MSENVKYCFDDEDVDKIVENMAEIQIRRLPVVNRQKRLVGIVSLGDIATTSGPEEAGVALSGISEPGGQHSQSATPPGVQHVMMKAGRLPWQLVDLARWR